MALTLDASRPLQVAENLLAFWLPRGRGKDDLAGGLVAYAGLCSNPQCLCTEILLDALPVDDRAEMVEIAGSKLRVSWRQERPAVPRPEGRFDLVLDIPTGVVAGKKGGAIPAQVGKFFEPVLPSWVLDHLWDLWRSPRMRTPFDWKEQALADWEPGLLLPTLLAFPESRPDRYVVGESTFLVDTSFCVDPACECETARLHLFRWPREGSQAEDMGSAELPLDTLLPVGFDGDPGDLDVFSRVYLMWTRRNVPLADRVRELRDLTRGRGRELYAAAGAPRPAEMARAAGASSARVGRNDPCPCGSGRKSKRCCGG